MSNRSQVMGLESWVMGLESWVYRMRQQHLDLILSIHRAIGLVGSFSMKGVIRQHARGGICGWSQWFL